MSCKWVVIQPHPISYVNAGERVPDYQEGQVSADTKRIAKAEQRCRSRIRQLLGELYAWLRAMQPGATLESVQYTEQQVLDIFAGGAMPWSGDSGGRYALKLKHGRAYHFAASDLERCKEEQASLPIQRARLVANLKHRIAQIRARVSELQRDAAQPGVGAAP